AIPARPRSAAISDSCTHGPTGGGPRGNRRGHRGRPAERAARRSANVSTDASRKPQAASRSLLECHTMRPPVELGEATAPSLLDGALALALATGAPLRLVGPLNGADAALVMAAARIGDAATAEATRAALGRTGPVEPAPALTPLQLVHRGILRQASLVAATAQGRDDDPLRAAQAAARKLRAHGVIAEPERVPLPHPQGSRGGRWALTAVAEFEDSIFTASALGARRERPELLGPQPKAPPEEAGERVAERLGRFLAAGGA